MNQLPEWLDQACSQLGNMRQRGRLPHALVITGSEGLGKRNLADWLAGILLCESSPDGVSACGKCRSCGWFDNGSHPDYLLLQPEEAGKALKVDQVRALGASLSMTSHSGGYKIAIVQPADAMNINAANSLLKTLEEPTANTLLILLTAIPGRLPATIRSRCQRINIERPSESAARDWLLQQQLDETVARRCLVMAGGAPYKALALAVSGSLEQRDTCLDELLAVYYGKQDPLKAAEQWARDVDAQRNIMQWWQQWIYSLIRWKQTGLAEREIEVAQKLQQIVEKVDCTKLFVLSDRLASAISALASGLNRQLLLEDLLIDWAGMSAKNTGQNRPTQR
jgi:DNA polymerase III subunit delta'